MKGATCSLPPGAAPISATSRPAITRGPANASRVVGLSPPLAEMRLSCTARASSSSLKLLLGILKGSALPSTVGRIMVARALIDWRGYRGCKPGRSGSSRRLESRSIGGLVHFVRGSPLVLRWSYIVLCVSRGKSQSSSRAARPGEAEGAQCGTRERTRLTRPCVSPCPKAKRPGRSRSENLRPGRPQFQRFCITCAHGTPMHRHVTA